MNARIPKWLRITSSVVVVSSLIPSIELRMSVWSVLALPFQWLYSPPLVYSDKPWFLTYVGGIVTAIAWSLCLLVIAMLVSFSKRKDGEA